MNAAGSGQTCVVRGTMTVRVRSGAPARRLMERAQGDFSLVYMRKRLDSG